MKPHKITELEVLASKMVGDRKSPNSFFVTNQGVVITVTRDFDVAYNEWHNLAYSGKKIKCALEDRHSGVIASVEPNDNEKDAKPIIIDDSYRFRSHYRI